MSDGDKSHTDVLLPAARVALFTRDAQTRATFESIRDDWRFARVEMQVIEGDTETAAAQYRTEASPQLIIVQTDSIDNGFSEKLEALSQACAEGTSAMVVGPVNDVNLYRKLIGMGVSDYLVVPVERADLAEDIATSLITRMGAAGSRLIVTLGAKGGVGATSLTTALTWGISENFGQKTFLLDGAGGWSTLAVGMDFEPATTLPDALRAALDGKDENLARMYFRASDRLTVLSSGGDVMLEDKVQAEHFEYLIDYVMTTYPVVVLDLSGASAPLKNAMIRRAHKVLLVTTPTLPAVRASRTLLQEIKDLRGGTDKDVELIVNMHGLSPRHEVNRAQIEQGLERKVSAQINFDPALFISAESNAKKLNADKEGMAVMDALLPLVRKVLSLPASAETGKGDDGKKAGIGGLLSRMTKSKA